LSLVVLAFLLSCQAVFAAVLVGAVSAGFCLVSVKAACFLFWAAAERMAQFLF
jgi:hypothetical protein